MKFLGFGKRVALCSVIGLIVGLIFNALYFAFSGQDIGPLAPSILGICLLLGLAAGFVWSLRHEHSNDA